ncbi:TlyA family rRNA (cytidine-2'-O)-methyltransferase [Paenibacillus sp. MY03]|jgi:23S rRNA (cytidine1920-2'-O)/16S rRNA (cytidine1409-2'-O)-methyltransferase|uniref:TlyA family RNA methyltransferase n=1 Tax=Paenibacillus sp. MY03 TaxID=302980 RepID=UPI000B3D48D0|nr:TlyA family RNA methyltransferase [Paenibacillus sp. MY03]OUS77451.1 TlyA family rRNA (cytidine-2'-O)-methyltransferase [Paenibacillus sp. MY03]
MTTTPKERIDVLLVERGYFDSREKAKKALMAGLVLVDDEPVDKSGMKVPRSADIKVKGVLHPYVSRGGLKLEKAIKLFGIDLTDKVMLDIGASTGGFTDCALQNGASYVYAIDVGYNQLDWSLRQHPQVGVMERTNFRYMLPEHLTGPPPSFASIDVSFISLKHILPTLATLLPPSSGVVALIKPQFEAGREKVGKSGVVREPSVHAEVLRQVLGYASETGYVLQELTFSPITGGEGNIEFLAYWLTGASENAAVNEKSDDKEARILALVEEANRTFKAKV